MRPERPGSGRARRRPELELAPVERSPRARACRVERPVAGSAALEGWQPSERGIRLVIGSLVAAASAGALCVAHTAWVVMG